MSAVSEDSFWGAVTVLDVRSAADPQAGRPYPTYYGCTFRVLDLIGGADKELWYRISDGIVDKLFVKAEAIRQILSEEFTSLSPNVPLDMKRIDVDLKQQFVTAFEGDKIVFGTRVATGAVFRNADGTVQSFAPTPGDHRIYEKRPSRRMIGGPAGDASSYDLPGINWVSYFTRTRIAFHVTYWHNYCSRPRSHGCVNMLPEDAKWVYRWTLPAAEYDAPATFTEARDDGSLVRVF